MDGCRLGSVADDLISWPVAGITWFPRCAENEPANGYSWSFHLQCVLFAAMTFQIHVPHCRAFAGSVHIYGIGPWGL